MSDRHRIPPELRKLIDEMLDGVITPGGVQRLEESLDGNPEEQSFFRNYCQLHINLDAETRTQRVVNDFKDRESNDAAFHAAATPVSSTEPEPSTTKSSFPVLGFIADLFQGGADRASHPGIISSVIIGGIAVAVLILAIGFPHGKQEAVEPQPVAVNPLKVDVDDGVDSGNLVNSTNAEFVACITDSHNVRWSSPAFRSGHQQKLWVGQELKLAEGLVEISFDVGAKVLMEGPAALKIDSPTQATLAYGQLTAQVSEKAIGFTIETPMVNVVDLGTEFGVRVSRKGMTDVAVFSGKVVAAPRHSGANTEKAVPVVADEVRRFWNGSIKDEEPLAAPNFSLSIPKAIRVNNPSFESPSADGWLAREISGWQIASEPQWTGRPNGGVQLVDADRIQLPAPADGRQWGFIETRKAADGGVHHTHIYQAVGKLAPNTLYRLKMSVGYEAYTTHGMRAEFPFSWDGQDSFEVGLWSGKEETGQPQQSLKVLRDPVPQLRPGSSEEVTVTYRSPAVLPPNQQVLFIRLSLAANDWCRVLFDDVHLEAVPMGNNWTARSQVR